MHRITILLLSALLLCVSATSCRVARHVAPGQSVVKSIEILRDGMPATDPQLKLSVQQKPYRRAFGFLPVSTWIWHPDTISAWHRFRGRLGTAPTIYSEEQTLRTDLAMRRAMEQMGYLDARVTHRTRIHEGKAQVTYLVESGRPRVLNEVRYVCDDASLQPVIDADADQRLLSRYQLLNRQQLESERNRLTTMMRELGYWDFDREHVSYLADTINGSDEVDLTCVVSGEHRQWHIRRVHFITNYNMLNSVGSGVNLMEGVTRPMEHPGYDITFDGERSYLRERTLIRNSYVIPGMVYSERAIRNTYQALSRLHILRYVSVRVEPINSRELDCFIYLTPNTTHAVQFEIDGTNTAGDLGFSLGLTYQDRNIFRGSEALTTHVKGSYESLSGNVEKLVNDNYQEYAAEVSIDFPQFLFPFISDGLRRKSQATSVLQLSFAKQSRPEYSRNIANGAFGYKWNSTRGSARHMWDLLNLSYVYLPEQSETFKEIVDKLGPIIYSSYTSHFILGMDYTLYMGNNTLTAGREQQTTRDLWYLRINPELAGTAMSWASKGLGQKPNADGRYHLLGQPYEQYARFDVDFSYSHYLTDRSRLALHGAGGVAAPYGNSDVMPFEKRYYSGGANSVRGWSVRELGPGRYAGRGAAYNYFNQCGDIRLDGSVELRTRLVGGIESALFVDAGNVWTIKDYESQEGGEFTADFYKQIALSWGVGIRLVSDFILVRLDWGFKAHDPSSNTDERWPLSHPFRGNHNTIHFAVGYPF